MKKTLAFILSGLMMTSTSAMSTAYAAETEETSTPSISEIIYELNKNSTSYIENFDFNADGTVDSFDMVALRKKLVTGESSITISTAVKLQRWLLGIDTSLGRSDYAYDSYNPSIFKAECFKNLMSNDFRFVGCNESILVHYNGDTTKGVEMCFLGTDEYIMEHVFIYDFCNSSDEFDELVAEGKGFSIGVKDKSYALALTASNESETTTTTTTEEKIGTAFFQYNLTTPNLSTEKVLQLVDMLSNSLNSTPYSFTIRKDSSSSKIELIGENELSELSILVNEFEPVRETPILETDSFYLFYDNNKGFGLTEK